jgi:carboxymethylenebutenolidase
MSGDRVSGHRISTGEWITVGTPDGTARAYAVKPETPAPWPALILIQAVTGVETFLQGVATQFASEGYFVVAPALYSFDAGYEDHRPEHIEIAAHMGTDPAQQQETLTHYPAALHPTIWRAREWMSRRRSETYVRTARATFDMLKAHRDVRAIGALGFCMGGRMVGDLAATGAELAAGVIYYGAPPKLDLVPKIVAPLEGHYASRDLPITDKIPEFAAAMKAAGKDFTYYVYEADHGFSLSERSRSHNVEATRISRVRAKAFLADRLKPVAPARAAQ